MSLIDEILKADQARRIQQQAREALGRESTRAETARRARQEGPVPPAGTNTHAGRWAADPNQSLCGLAPGDAFVMTDCGDELSGVWVVRRVTHAATGRDLMAVRPDGAGPSFTIDEAELQACIEGGQVTRTVL
ncbi:MAG: hypothetical protein ACI9WU_000003 [Myxococcota bacterium]|jgi:hypothetical protein